MATINPHINFNGNAEEAFNFYKSIFGGEFSGIMRYKEIASAEYPVPAHEENKIMHIALRIGQGFLMGNDVPESMGRTNENENRSKIYVRAENKDEAFHIFNGLSSDGQVELPIEEYPTGQCYAMFRDKYGIESIIDYDPNSKR